MIVLKPCNKIDDELPFEYEYYYEVYIDDKKIGLSAISTKGNDALYLFLFEEFRGNNYGTETFELLLEKFKELSINQIKLTIDNANIQMIRIIRHHDFKIVNSGEGFKTYEIKF